MPIGLTTGVPGAGKTLYTVSEVLKRLVGATAEVEGRAVPRRLCIAGIPDLLLPHELVESRKVPPEGYTDPWGGVLRSPGDPVTRYVRLHAEKWVACDDDAPGAVPVPCSVENWWLWVEPGDVVVIDECQNVFRPMPAGRRAPTFITQLEVHRHYGVDFELITQHPQLLHTAVRALVGQHRHVRRLFGRRAALVYEWDHCSPPERVKTASTKPWFYKKAAFGLYKSAQLHTKQRWGTSWPLVIGLLVFLALPFLWWRAVHGTSTKAAELAAAPAASASQAVVGVAPPAAASTRSPAVATAGAVAVWPVMNVAPARLDREPYADRGLQIEGGMTVDGKVFAIFGIVQDGKRLATVTLAELVRAGYAFTFVGPCAGVLRYKDQERPLSCGPRGEAPAAAPVPAPAASAAPAMGAV